MQMVVQRGYVYRAYPTDEVKSYFMQCFGADRKMYNLHVDKFYSFLEDSQYQVGERVDIKALKAQMPTVAEFKKMITNPEGEKYLYEVDAFACNEAKQHFWKALSEFNKIVSRKQFQRKALKRKRTEGIEPTWRDLKGLPRFHSRKNNDYSYTTFNQNGNIFIDDCMLFLPTAQKSVLKKAAVRLRIHRPLPEGSTIKHVTVSMNAKGQFFVSLCMEFLKDIKEAGKPERFLGLDYSQSDFFVDSEGKKANYPLFMRKAEERLAQEQKKLSRMVKGSHRYEKQRQVVANLHNKVVNQRNDWLHKKAYALAKRYDVVVVEDLDLRLLSQNKRFAKKQQDNGFGKFRLYLQYKLEQQGKLFLKASKDFPSTQLCSCCGYKNEALKGLTHIGIREWKCPVCHRKHDRDINSGKNLKQYGEKAVQELFTF